MPFLRHAFRSLLRTPGFSAVLIAIIALGIGANTAIFSVVQAVLLRPLPLHEPDRLVRLYESRLHGTSVQDPVALGSVAVLLLFAAAVACWVPARRAARVNPIEALRSE